MTGSHHANPDRPDPSEQSPHLRARVPDHVADGAFSTGAIVVTGPTEFIIDFLQTIGRPHRVAARIVMPHAVMPQFIEALAKNLSLYRERFGPPPQPPGLAGPATALGATGVPQQLPQPAPPGQEPAGASGASSLFGSTDVFPGSSVAPQIPAEPGSVAPPSGPGAQPGHGLPEQAPPQPAGPESAGPEQTGAGQASAGQGGAEKGGSGKAGAGQPAAGQGAQPAEPSLPRRPTPQEIYDDLKLPDHVLSGAYANGVMIGHGASEFGLDFLTSFYPQSAVSARVFLAAGQVPRLVESLQHAMRQLQHQRNLSQRPPRQPPQRPDDEGPEQPPNR